ncbi:retinoid-inducible serine carboxypeptidase-like [Maniola jurtina]|uniref:retinoid-inducible serine carboxypeptidase-like n=1 Tax=Maniola jurtina TaxID=191418 RepID=UPI001E6869A7|nr:retinoid-inducible serine carboxypeptidase-like [Maniola jurtina]
MQTFVHYAVALIFVFSFVVQLDAVTVNPLAHICPTNKIAPRRKRYDTHPRTFGQFYNLLTPNNSPSSLQEQPQEDLPDDCGDIEDYDENDIGSVTQRPIRRQGYQRNHFKKKGSSHSHRPSQQHLINQHNQYGKPPSSKPTRPPPAGYFGTNSYSPPKPQQPTEKNPYLEALERKPWESVHKYIEVRRGAFIFYWLYYADGVQYGSDHKPLIIWIQGGPGHAASGLGNFAEIGPLTMDMRPRNHTWVNGRNVLLIDHPVGSGFSYAVNETLLVKTDKEAAKDLLRAIKEFYNTHKEFRKTPTYLFGQSYGGKLCPRLGYYLHRAIKHNRLKMNFKGIGIGSGWVNPKLSTLAQPEFLYNMGVIDQPTYTKAMKLARNMSYLIDKKEYATAETLDNTLFHILILEAGMEINFNNINQPSDHSVVTDLAEKMNRYVKPTLQGVCQTLTWTWLAIEVYESLSDSFLVPSNKFLETLLDRTELKIAVYNGNLDVVTPLAGAANWVHALKWHGAHEFMNARRIPIRGDKNGFYKAAKQLSFWAVFGSGHWVPEDNPTAMEHILEYVIEDTNLVHPDINTKS